MKREVRLVGALARSVSRRGKCEGQGSSIQQADRTYSLEWTVGLAQCSYWRLIMGLWAEGWA